MAYNRTVPENHYSDYRYVFQDQGNPNLVTTGSRVSVYNSTRAGSKVDYWREKIRSRSDATSAFSVDAYRLKLQPGSAYLRTKSVSSGSTAFRNNLLEGNFEGPNTLVTHLSSPTSVMDAECLAHIYQQIRRVQSEASTMSSLAEGIETLRMFGRPFRSLVSLTNGYLDELKRVRQGRGKRRVTKKLPLSKVVAGTYLEYAFGVAPLISDSESIAQALARWNLEQEGIRHDPPRLTWASSEDTAQYFYTADVDNAMLGNWLYYNRSTRVTTSSSIRYVVGMKRVNAVGAPGSLARLQELLGLGLRDFVPAVWEAVPWSWLIDYFSNVGDLLAAGCTSTAGVAWTSKTSRQSTLVERRCPVNVKSSLSRAQSSGYTGGAGGDFGGWDLTRTTLSRTKPTLGLPPLTLTFPVKTRQLMNMAAVLVQRRPESRLI